MMGCISISLDQPLGSNHLDQMGLVYYSMLLRVNCRQRSTKREKTLVVSFKCHYVHSNAVEDRLPEGVCTMHGRSTEIFFAKKSPAEVIMDQFKPSIAKQCTCTSSPRTKASKETLRQSRISLHDFSAIETIIQGLGPGSLKRSDVDRTELAIGPQWCSGSTPVVAGGPGSIPGWGTGVASD